MTSALEIARFLHSELVGQDMVVNGVCRADGIRDNKLAFLSKNTVPEKPGARALLIVRHDRSTEPGGQSSYIKVINPRLAFAKVVGEFFFKKKAAAISGSAGIGKDAVFGGSVSIGEGSVIGDLVAVGPNTVIGHNVVISEGAVIGGNCFIKSGSIIGEDGFGFDFEPDGTPVKLPHMGRVVIGDGVEIGANCTIARGTLGDTVIGNNVKIDDQVHIAHNCRVGRNTMITAHCEISGSVEIGENCWLAPNCSIIQKIKIGNNVKIGIGAVVTNDIGDNKTVMGIEAMPLKDLIRFKRKAGIIE